MKIYKNDDEKLKVFEILKHFSKFIFIEKISLQRKKFEQEKYDETGGSLTPTQGLTSPTTLSHLPSIEAIPANKLQVKTPFKWKLDGFKNSNAPIILLGYKNRKWRNCNNFATITPTSDNDIYIISLVRNYRIY
jgi:hypothetical protein